MAVGSIEGPPGRTSMTNARKLILHVGEHKTGSTYLQKRLSTERAYLAGHGIWYPEEFISIFGHHRIAAFLQWQIDEEGVAQVRAVLSPDRAPADTAILSSENFCTLGRDRIAMLAELLRGWQVEIVYFLRHLGGFWVSHWQEMIKHGGDITFPEYLAQASAPDMGPRSRISQVEQLENLAEYFGRESIRIVAYDNVLGEKQDLYDYFLRMTVGIEPRDRATDERVNSSFGPQRVELLRALNTTYRRARKASPGARLRKAYMRRARRIEASNEFRSFAAAFDVDCEHRTIAPDWEPIRAREQELLSKFGDRIVNKSSDRSIFHEPPPAQARFVSRTWVSEAGQAEWVSALAHSLVAQMEEDGAVRP